MKRTFSDCHPAVSLIYFTAVIAGTVRFRHPVYLAISVSCACIYSACCRGGRSALRNLCLLPFAAVYALWYSLHTHFGVTVLAQNGIGNNMTAEALAGGLLLGLSAVGAVVWLSCFFAVFSADRVTDLFGKISPRLALFSAALFRMLPRIAEEAKKMNTARSGIGLGIGQGSAVQRMRNALRLFSMLVTETVDALMTASDSVRSRGGSLRGRSAFSVYRFDNRDRLFVVVLFAFLTLTEMGELLGQTAFVYNPRILWVEPGPLSYVFYSGYAALCLMPSVLDLWAERKFDRAVKNMK